MTVQEIADVIEQAAPPGAQAAYDNSGLIVGRPGDTVSGVLVCVDVNDAVLDEAAYLGADMVVSHHPLIFDPLRRLTDASLPERVAARAVREGVALYAAHTNLDCAPGGMSHRLAGMLGVQVTGLLDPLPDRPGFGYGVVGELRAPIPVREFLRGVADTLRIGAIRHSALCRPEVRRVALCTGSGGSLIDRAAEAGADIYLAADFKYNHFIEADGRLAVADIGHFESEYCAIDLLFDIITKKIATFAVHKSVQSRNPVNYFV
ncbi:MAG: Nif3-like dinuclear metal center hexameric protein [Rikenellaceae bacterium]|nr:Nif3-like dinuclear metal center hexameric protein [Rikenellaceae bacterium]